MTPDSNTSRFLPPAPRPGAVPGRLVPAGSAEAAGRRGPLDLAVALRVCAAELDDDGRRTGMTPSLAARLMREASGMIVVMSAFVPEGRP